MIAVNHHWKPRDIVGGNSALDLVNTVSGWGLAPEDWIPDITSLLAWAQMSTVLNRSEKDEAACLAKSFPVASERVLASLKELRFALWVLTDSLEAGKPHNPAYLSVVNEWARQLALSQQVIFKRNKLEFEFNRNVSALELPGLRVAAAALSLFRDPPVARIKTCAARDCGWKFVDQSKNKSRRWCDMAVCGNSAKAKRHRARSE